jgi:hypothetical protein
MSPAFPAKAGLLPPGHPGEGRFARSWPPQRTPPAGPGCARPVASSGRSTSSGRRSTRARPPAGRPAPAASDSGRRRRRRSSGHVDGRVEGAPDGLVEAVRNEYLVPDRRHRRVNVDHDVIGLRELPQPFRHPRCPVAWRWLVLSRGGLRNPSPVALSEAILAADRRGADPTAWDHSSTSVEGLQINSIGAAVADGRRQAEAVPSGGYGRAGPQ